MALILRLLLAIKKIMNLILQLLMMPFAIIILLLRPIIFIRFGILSYKRIGHLTIDTAIYFSKKKKFNDKKIIDIIGYSFYKSCNKQLIKIWSRRFNIFRAGLLIETIKNSLELLTRSKDFTIDLYGLDKDRHYIEGNYISFTENEINFCNKILSKLNIPKDKKWVCIHNRDNAYFNKKFKLGTIINKNRDHSLRNFPIDDMINCSLELSKLDYYVIRVGSIQETLLDTGNDKIIDYSQSKYRSDLFDIFLLSKCHFYLGSDSGIANVAVISNKYIGWINQMLYSNWSYPVRNRISIYKQFYSNELKRPLSVKEIYKKGYHQMSYVIDAKNANLELINNTPEEINELSKEILSRLNNTWRYTKEEEILHKKYKDILKEIYSDKENLTNGSAEIIDFKNIVIGNFYLKNNLYLLD